MAQSLARVLVHIIFSTKARQPFLRPADLRSKTHAYLVGILTNLECQALQLGGVEDHVHVLCGLSRIMSLADLVKNLKASSTKHLKLEGCSDFAWQNGYGVFSVSESAKQSVVAYIANQERHHRTMTFQEEYRAFLRKHGIRFDEQYVWD